MKLLVKTVPILHDQLSLAHALPLIEHQLGAHADSVALEQTAALTEVARVLRIKYVSHRD